MANDEVGIGDFLSDQEIDLINYLRGWTEEGDAAPLRWSATIERTSNGGWRLVHRHGDALLIGEGPNFDHAWEDQCDPALRDAPASVSSAEAPPAKPRLAVIKGGRD